MPSARKFPKNVPPHMFPWKYGRPWKRKLSLTQRGRFAAYRDREIPCVIVYRNGEYIVEPQNQEDKL